jgi:ABC-type multidrug transport system ATPase subunit/predicted component of type VI protein secretion system
MIPGFGKQTITIGSGAGCDIVLNGPGVAAEHATITHQGGGRLMLTNTGQGQTAANGRMMGAGEHAPFDFRTQFQIGQVNLPFDHPALALCLMTQGQVPPAPGRVVIGRDPAQVSLVLQHPSVSSLHCSIAFDQGVITDHQSTSGTYLGGNRLPPNAPTPLQPDSVIHIGPVPVPASLLHQISQHAAGGQPMAPPQQPQAQAQPAAAAAAGAAGHQPMRKHKTVFGQLDFGAQAGGVKSIGRTPNNDIVVPHPQVSANHAQVEQAGGQIFVTDKGSANGTYVRGHRLQPGQKAQIESGEKIYVGPMPLQLNIGASGAVEVVHEAYAEEQWAGRPLFEIEAWSLFLQVPDRDDKSKDKVLLDNISFKALPGDMIALMGPSGAGKTTLLLTLNGYMPPTEGLVRINGEDLYNIYDTLRGSIGYVPQDDLVHPELTVFEAVRYSAKFRLPPDYSDDEIEGRVMQTLADLGLEAVAHLQIGAPEKKILSGGQRKRVNIALELVTDPVILYLDEPTSGLAADDATALIELLNKLTKATGKTIIMTIHQPAKEEYEKFSHALVLGYGGVPMFFGATLPDSYQFFGGFGERHGKAPVDNPRDMFENITDRERPIYEALKAQNASATRADARHAAALEWRQEYFNDANPTYKKMYSGRRSVGTGEGQRGIPEGRPTTRGQFRLLLSRYFKTKVRDVGGTAIMLAQAPIIGVLLAMVFGGQNEESPAWCLGALQQLAKRSGVKDGDSALFDNLTTTQDHTGALFFLVVSAIWFGTSNAAREIVRERSIYLRERMVNLGLINYVMSKFVLLSLFCVVQCGMLLGIVFFALGFNGGIHAFLIELAALVATSICAVSLGLLLSTLVATSEAAMALTPIALIPQVVLGGLMVPATTIPKLAPVMNAIPARWGFEAVVIPERTANAGDPAWLIDLGTDQTSAPDFVFNGKFECSTAQLASDQLNGAWSFTTYETTWIPFAVLGGITVGIVLLMLMALKRRDPV